MLSREEVRKQFDGITEEESLKILAEQYHISWTPHQTTCKYWFAEVFTYCNSNQLEYQLNDFLWFINFIVVPLTRSCFKEEDIVSLGSTGTCGHKQTVLFFTLTPMCMARC